LTGRNELFCSRDKKSQWSDMWLDFSGVVVEDYIIMSIKATEQSCHNCIYVWIYSSC